MDGRKIYEYALINVPLVIKSAIDKAGFNLSDVKKVLVHQANGKMDEAILKRLFKLYGAPDIPENVMPMTIAKLGNSSVATIPTLLDLIVDGKMENHEFNKGDVIVFASVGAGMNINALVYKY
jgi:3-oxoacyl-[acyl-carrier-protein] synthase-3